MAEHRVLPVKTNEPPQSTFLVSIDQLKAEDRLRHEPFHEMIPEKTFVRQWALTLLDRVMASLQAEASLKGKTQVFEEVRPVILGREAGPSYAEISAKLGLSETTLKVTVHRYRTRYRAHRGRPGRYRARDHHPDPGSRRLNGKSR